MKKTAIFTLLTLVSLFTFTACSSTPVTDSRYYELIGKSVGDVYTAINVTANDVTDAGNNAFKLPNSETHLGNDYFVTLLFDENDKLSGYTYTRDFKQDKEEFAVNFFTDVVSRLTKLHGDVTTDETLENRFSAFNEPLDALTSGKYEKILETWDLKDKNKLEAEAIIQYTPKSDSSEAATKITVTYKTKQPSK